jgi:amino acid transporter
VTASTVANIGPGIDFYFAFGAIVVAAGIAAPLTIVAGGVAVALLAFTVAEFTRVEPSAGSFITYVEASLGPAGGVAVAWLVAIGYSVAIAGVFAMTGGMLSLTFAHYTSWDPSWFPWTLGLTIGAVFLTARGIKLSTGAIAVAVVFQVSVMLAVCFVVLVDERASLSLAPFSWAHLTGGLSGLSAGFPLALYMFIGWENGPALSEESRNPSRTVPRALFISVAIAAVLFVLFAYATVTGFHYDVSSIGRSSIPFLSVADNYLGDAAVLAWVAGFIAVLATLMSAVNSQSRMLYGGGRSKLLPSWLGRVPAHLGTPVNALAAMCTVGLGIVAIWWTAHVLGGTYGSADPVGLYAEASTMGTIVILFVYVLTTLSLPVFMWRRHRTSFSAVRHVAVPVLGAASLVVPFVELLKPGQPAPYSRFPYVALVILVAVIVTAWITVRRNPSAGSVDANPPTEGPD